MANSRTIALLYCLYAGLGVLLLAPAMPPMQNADETNHTYRADQVSRFGLFGKVIADGEFGGVVSSGIALNDAATLPLRSHPERKLTRDMLAPSTWGAAVEAAFPNTAVNPPFFYVPAAVADSLVRHARIHFPNALFLMRSATGFVTVVIAATAIALAGEAALWLFAVLLLPMSLGVTAAISQDGPMLACTALMVALYLRLRGPNAARKGLTFGCLCLLMTMLGMARAPYLAFALLAITAPVSRSRRIIGVAFILICVIAWSGHSAAHFPLPARPDGIVSPALQCLTLITHPWRVPLLLVRTLQANGVLLAHGFIGQLGWLDTPLSEGYYVIAWAGLGLAILATWHLRPLAMPSSRSVLEALAVIGAAGGVWMIQYLIWTSVGSPLIDGVQGRYFLAPALVMGVLFARGADSVSRVRLWLAFPVLALPVLSISVTLHAVIERYYY